ncbi:MAG: cobyrinate a,c-diamide synthase, partial [Dactylosporangium sp.]|nr:cobyrinate a,c-diamide synthase [Dactylosporangium sp.]NNJ62964.1 cobyrinate a,c-diamide synthase [Dactylosporangium sp.]
MSAVPRVVLSAPSSGHGKTAISVGLLAALTARGMRTVGFKAGPDYVDAAYLGLAAGPRGRNLDPRLVGTERVGPLFTHGAAGADIAVIEGTMGLYDGLAGRTDAESTAQIAGLLKAPVVLVVDVAAMGQSIAALVHGFRAYDETIRLGGVILNRIDSDRHEHVLREALDDIGVPVLGALRRRVLSGLGANGAPLPSRHEGVGPVAQGGLDATRATRRLGEVISRTVDLERLVAIARSAPELAVDRWSPEAADAGGDTRHERPPLIAVAGGPRLTFGYIETAELLRGAGADVIVFDPVRDAHLPAGAGGVVLGGGMPEAYAEELSANEPLRAAVATFARAGGPIIAEGTGLVWLCQAFAGRPMCGVLDAKAGIGELIVLGYRRATSVTSSVLLPAGTTVVGHKLHRTVVAPRSGPHPAWSWPGGRPEGFVHRGVHASYLALHWAGSPGIAARFVAAAAASAASAASAATVPASRPVSA